MTRDHENFRPRLIHWIIAALIAFAFTFHPGTVDAAHPKSDPQASHGQDCQEHGANPDGNEDHCEIMPGPTDEPEASPSNEPNPEVTPSATPAAPSTDVIQPVPEPERTLSPVAYPDGANQPLPNTAMEFNGRRIGAGFLIGLGVFLCAFGIVLIIDARANQRARTRRGR